MEKQCDKHSDNTESDFYFDGRKWRCRKCNCDSVTKFRRSIKPRLIEQFGGRCEICAYNKSLRALEFHHIYPEDKSFTIGSGDTHGLAKQIEETKKCVLLCANCHMEVEDGLQDIPQYLIDRVDSHRKL